MSATTFQRCVTSQKRDDLIYRRGESLIPRSNSLCSSSFARSSFWTLTMNHAVQKAHTITWLATKGARNYKVVQIWPGLFTHVYIQISPGHIWTTLYLKSAEFLLLPSGMPDKSLNMTNRPEIKVKSFHWILANFKNWKGVRTDPLSIFYPGK